METAGYPSLTDQSLSRRNGWSPDIRWGQLGEADGGRNAQVRGGIEVKCGTEVQEASLQGDPGPHEGAPHCHVRQEERGWKETFLGAQRAQRQAPFFVFLEGLKVGMRSL